MAPAFQGCINLHGLILWMQWELNQGAVWGSAEQLHLL